MNGIETIGKEQQRGTQDDSWPFWPIVPLYPYRKRVTLRREVVKDTIWTFEQVQGILYVVVPIRMTVVKLSQGGLLVYAPVAPTTECLELLNELVAAHGEVKYIILPTISGLEHKVFVGPFARRFPQAQVFVAPQQWSFPLNLPLSWLGFPRSRTQVLPENSSETPFAEDFDYEILGPLDLGLGAFGEVAFFHRPSRSLLLTDSAIAVPEAPPAIVNWDPYPLLFHAKDNARDAIADSETARRKGWQRICLFACYFRPSALETIEFKQAWREARYASDRSKKAYFGLFPFAWKAHWQRSFEALRGGGRLFVAPILQKLILNRAPKETLDWADLVSRWYFERIIPCHFDAPIAASAHQFRQAFAFLEKQPRWNGNGANLPPEDFEFLTELEEVLDRRGITPPAKAPV